MTEEERARLFYIHESLKQLYVVTRERIEKEQDKDLLKMYKRALNRLEERMEDIERRLGVE